jgi:hypothetical protein
MWNRLSALGGWAKLYYGPVPVLAALVLAFSLVQHCWPALTTGQKYTDLVVGSVTWHDEDKGRDFRALVLFLGSAATCAAGIGALFRRVGRDGPESDVGRGLTCLLLFATLPALWWFGRSAVEDKLHVLPTPFVLLILAAVAAAAGLRRYRDELTSSLVLEVGGAVVLLTLLAEFAGLGVATFVGRLFPMQMIRLERFAGWFAGAPPVAAFVAAAVAFYVSPRLDVLRRRLLRGLFLVQVPLPLLFCILIPAPLQIGDDLQRIHIRAVLPVTLAALTLLCWFLLARRYRAWRAGSQEEAGLGAVLSSLALAAVPVFVLLPGSFLPIYMADLFHAGEQMLPWQQLAVWHKLPYADFIPIHGLMPLVHMGSASLFYDATSASYVGGDHVLVALWAVTTFLALRPLIGPVAALFLALCVPPLDRYYFLAPAVLFLAHRPLLDRPARWLTAWSLLIPLLALYNAAIGPAFAIGTAPVALWMVWRLLRHDRTALLRVAIGWGAALLVVVWVPPVWAVARGFVAYVTENAATNDVANGIAWERSFELKMHGGIANVYFLWETLRFAWVFVLAGAGLLFFRELARPRGERNVQVFWLAAMVAPTMLLVTPWALGRIDPDGRLRTGGLSIVGVVFLLPALLLAGRRAAGRPLVAALLVLALSVIDLGGYCAAFEGGLSSRPFNRVGLAAGTELTDGRALGMPAMGRVLISPEQTAELTELKRALDGWLRPGETFLDLTNHSGYYYYFNLPVPSLYSATYVACNSRMQGRMLATLDANPPPVVLVAPAITHDGGPASLRSYHLYRAYVQRYVPVRRGRFTFLVAPDRVPEEANQDRAGRVQLLTEVFRTRDLHSIAAAWGRSWATLAGRFGTVARLEPAPAAEPPPAMSASVVADGSSHVVTYQLAGLGLAGKDADYLKIDFSCDRVAGQTEPVLQLLWQPADLAVTDWTLCTARGSCLLVPLGSYPSWLLSERVGTLEVRLANPATCRNFTVLGAQLLRLKPGD